MKIVAKILIYDKNSHILVLVRGSTHPNFANHLDFPGGEIESGEGYISPIVREVKEELGLSLVPSKIKRLFNQKISNGLTHILFSYALDEIKPQIKLSWEHSSYKWIDKDKLLHQQLPLNVDPYYKDVTDYLCQILCSNARATEQI